MKPITKRILILVVLFFIAVAIGYPILNKKKLPVYNPSDINPLLVTDSLRSISGGHTIAPFKLINQNGDSISDQLFEGKIYVADFFFTTCTNICPIMTGQLKRVYDEYKGDSSVMFLSHTSLPESDTPPILKKYSLRFGAELPQWQFVTGDKKEIYHLARNSYLAVKTKGNGDKDDFIHTENLMLIDAKKRIRGFYDGTSTNDVNQLIEDIDILKEENR
ncbi:MAG: SCO family protein [Bacteroidetes bacterium]|nr:SCO family protein [Bacteroidota bacterium]